MRSGHLRTLVRSSLLAVAAALPAGAQNVLSLDPTEQNRSAGETASLDLSIDFTDPALGGGVVIGFNTTHLSLAAFDWNPGAPDDPALRLVCPGPDTRCASFPGPGLLVAFAVDTIGFPAIAGVHTLGTVQFDVLSTRSSAVTLAEDTSVAGPIVGTGSFAPPTLIGANVWGPLPTVPALGGLGSLLLAGGLAGTSYWLLRSRRRFESRPANRSFKPCFPFEVR